MRNGFLGLAVAMLVTNAAVAADADDAKALLEKAANAYGDKETRAKYKGEKSTYTGELALMGNTVAIEGTSLSTKGKAKSDLELTTMGVKVHIKQACDGTKVAMVVTVGGMEMKPTVADAEADEIKLTAYMHEVMTIDGLKDEKRFTVKALPEEEVEKTKYDVVEVTVVPLNRTVKLYLDKETHLVTMLGREGLIPGNKEGKKGQLLTKLSEFKKVDGQMVPMKITSTVDGADYLTVKVTEHTHLEKVDDKDFAIED